MAEFPAMPLWTDAYLGDTNHLTTIEHGAYLLLLITMWRTKAKTLTDDDRLLARYARLTGAQWRRIKPVIEPFFDVENGVWMQGRLTDEANAVRQHSKLQSDKAKARWLKTKKTGDAVAMPDVCPLTLPIKKERDTNVSPKKSVSAKTPASILSTLLGDELAGEVVEHRQRIRKPMTVKAATLLLGKLEQCADPRAGAETMIERGWQSFDAKWMNGGKGKADDKFTRKMEMASRFDGRGEAEKDMAGGEGGGDPLPLLPARGFRGS